MASTADVTIPAAVATVSALATYLLGRRNQATADRDQTYEQAWRLVAELRIEVDRLHARIVELEAHLENRDREHVRDRERWAMERRALIAAFRRGDDPTPPPLSR